MAAIPYDDQKRFMEEMILRFEKAFRSVDESLRENTEALRKLWTETHEHREDYYAESRAQRQALLHILDELKGEGGSGPAPAA